MEKESKLIKGLHYLFLSFVFVIGLVAIIGTGGCGGGSSGGGGGGDGSTSLATGGFTKTIADDNNWAAIYFWDTTYHSQNLYPAGEINGSGNITSIFFQYNFDEAVDITCADVTIKMGHTTSSSLVTTFANNVENGAGSAQTVLANASIVIPAGLIGDWVEIPLGTPFYYNGVDNLVVDITTNVACNGNFNADVTNTVGIASTVYDTDINAATGWGSANLRADMEFHFEGGVNPVEFAPLPGASNVYPFSGPGWKVQLLYDATLINGSGPITGIAMRNGFAVTTDQSYTYTIRVGHSTLTDLTADFNGNFSDTPVTVADNESFIVPAGIPVGDYIWIPMPDGSFTYNGSDNLIVEIDTSSSTGTIRWGMDSMGSDITRALGNSGSDTAGSVDNSKYHISFRFNGGTLDVITAEDGFWNVPFTDSFNIRSQILFDAWQFGTGGPVTGISFRLAFDSVASDYPAATVVLGHTTNTVLSITFADNMTDPTTVFTGTLNIPAGLNAGDWFTIPVSGFTYDPTQNLVFEVNQDAGTAMNRILATGVDVPGASGGMSGPKGNPVASVAYSFGQSDIRVHLSK